MGINKISGYTMPKKDELPENKIKWDIKKEEAILLIHDMQKYFTDAFNKDEEPYVDLVENIKKIKEYCSKEGIPVVYSAQPEGQTNEQRGLLMDFWGKGIPAGEGKQEIIEELKPNEEDIVITKWRYSAFEGTELEEFIRKSGKNQIIITGIYGHIGCLTTAINASMKNIKPFVIADAISDFSREKHLQTLEYVSQLAGKVIDTKQLIDGK